VGTNLAHGIHASDFEEGQEIAMVHDAHRVGIGVANADLGRR